MENYQKLAAQMEEQVKAWQEQVAKFNEMLPKAPNDVANQYSEGLKTLTSNMEDAQAKLAELSGANADAWKELEKGGRKAFEEWQKGWEKAMSKYKP